MYCILQHSGIIAVIGQSLVVLLDTGTGLSALQLAGIMSRGSIGHTMCCHRLSPVRCAGIRDVLQTAPILEDIFVSDCGASCPNRLKS